MDSDGPKTFFVLAILAMVTSTVLLRPPASLAQSAGDQCRSKPGSTAPPGTRWYYRVNPANNERCWFLDHEGSKARLRVRDGAPTTSLPRGPPQREDAGEAARAIPAQANPAPTTPTEAGLQIAPAHEVASERAFNEAACDEQAAAIDFDSRWPNIPMSLGGPEMMRKIHTEEQADRPEQIPLVLSISVSMPAFRPAFAVSVLAIMLLIAGPIFIARRRGLHRRNHWRPAADQCGQRQLHTDFVDTSARRSAREQRRGRSVQQPPMPTDPAHDLKRSLHELMGDLQRAGAASDPLRSFAPAWRGDKCRRVVGSGASGRTRSVSAPLHHSLPSV
jgi:hypothetical protein